MNDTQKIKKKKSNVKLDDSELVNILLQLSIASASLGKKGGSPVFYVVGASLFAGAVALVAYKMLGESNE